MQVSHTDVRASNIADPESPALLAAEVNSLPAAQRLYAAGDYQVTVARRDQAPHLMREIGRLREVSFREVGEGTGKPLDIDVFDDWYQQLFVWNGRTRELVGAYRLCMMDEVRREQGPRGLYTKTLFRYDDAFLDRLGPALELGRSFVRPEYQGAGRALALLWRGIAHLLAARPRYRTLFGPVSVSAAYSEPARRLIAACLSSGPHRHPLAGHVAALRPVVQLGKQPDGLDEETKLLSRRVSELEPDKKGLPILVREYVKLGGKFLAFSTDPDFGGAMDGLVAVDLDRTNPKLLALYMGPENYAHFRRFERSTRPEAGAPAFV
ncbi:MAG: GNAT family N-acyltransferase [Deltaproteobacteria bacterium]